MKWYIRVVAVLGVIGSGIVPATELAAQSLPQLSIDKTQVSVSGLSSGAFMAHQFHVAYSASIMGAGIVAGGPYHCSQGSAVTAMGTCMSAFPRAPDPMASLTFAQAQAQAHTIDDLANLKNARVYLFSGTMDIVVRQPVMDSLNTLYGQWVTPANVSYTNKLPCGHAIISPNADYLHPCALTATPYVNNGQAENNYDQAGEIFKQIYGGTTPLNPRGQAVSSALLTFSQLTINPDAEKIGMNAVGHIYVPSTCAVGQPPCRLHVAFHGCAQSDGVPGVGDAFYGQSGYNEWAETNRIVVLYPQVKVSMMAPENPMGCWDFWGYAGPGFYSQSGPQMATIKAMIDRLSNN